jgi:phosphatidylinositol-3-phosphatase
MVAAASLLSRRRRWLVAAGVAATLVVVVVVALRVRPESGAGPLEAVPAGSVVPVPETRPVIVIMFENKNERPILDQTKAPYIDSLIADGALATDYQALLHPSQPNYIALFSGSTQGITDNRPHDIAAPTIADQLVAAGGSWKVFAENLPAGGCFTGETSSGGPDGAGTYARKHVPAISFTSISGSREQCANIRPLRDFRPDAADFIWVVPNLCHDMHDCSVADGDAWLASFAPKILASPAFRPGGKGVLYVTFDENDGTMANNEVVTFAVSPLIKPGTRTGVAHTHYSLLRTIESGLGLPCLAHACDANTMGEMFTP